MLNRRILLLLAVSAPLLVRAAATDEEHSNKGTYTVKEGQKQERKERSAAVVKQLEDASKDNELCPVAAALGDELRVLSRSKGEVNKKMLLEECGDYFLGKNEENEKHQQAYDAVTASRSRRKGAAKE